MKRSYPYNVPGPGPQGQGPSQAAYGQPPPPAGPAPPLPSSGPPQGSYANYGYGSVAPARQAAAPLNGAGAVNAHHQQWNQQWQQPQPPPPPPPQQQQQHYPHQQPNAVGTPGSGQFAAPRPPPQSAPYRNVAAPNANASPLNQNAAYSSYQPPQSVPFSYQPQASPMQSLSPSQHHQSSAPPAYAYTPHAQPHQNASPSPHHNNAQSWPGAYAPGPQVGQPNKKARYQAPAANTPAPPAPYGPHGAVHMAPAGAHMAGAAMTHFAPQQQYGWQAPQPGSAQQMNPLPVPTPPAAHGRVPSGGGFNVNVPAPAAQFPHSGKAGGTAPGRGMNRKGAQNRGNVPQNAFDQRAGLPANPNASVNAAYAPNGQTRAWGASSTGVQADRRVSSAGSVHSDKVGPAKKSIPGSKSMIPPNAPRGPNNARNHTIATSPATGPQVSKMGGVVGQTRRGAQTASTVASVTGDAAAKDSGSSLKRAHTDFRILGLEIKQLGWSWFAPRAPAKADAIVLDSTVQAPVSTQGMEEDTLEVDKADVATDEEVNAEEIKDEDRTVEDESVDEEIPEPGNQSAHEPIDADADAAAAADGDADADGEADDAGADANDDDEADRDAEAEDAEGDFTTLHADTETAASEHQPSSASTPEPSGELPKVGEAGGSSVEAQLSGKSKTDGAKIMANLRESTKLRLCFAAMSNAGPEGAPTGPKSSKVQTKTGHESSFKDENAAGETEIEPAALENVKKAESNLAATEAEKKDPLLGVAEGAVSKDGLMTTSSLEANESRAAVSPDNTRSAPGDEKEAPPCTPAEPAEAAVAGTDEANEKTVVEKSEAAEENATVKEEDAQQSLEIPADEAGKEAAFKADGSKIPRSTAEPSPQAKGPPQLSLNRIFLSFAANRKRLAIDAEVIQSVKIHRSQHWVEICIDASPTDPSTRKKGEEYLVCNGTLLEKRSKGQENYTAVTKADVAAAWKAAEASVEPPDVQDWDHLELPPLFRLDSSSELVLQVHLDPSAPLPEPAWLRKNNVSELLATLQRGSTANVGRTDAAASAATAQHVWAGKIEIMDPDPPPSMSTLLYEWAKESFIGSQKERRKFVDELLGKKKHKEEQPVKVEGSITPQDGQSDARVARNLIEIVLRLIKGERVPPGTNAAGALTAALESTCYTTSTTYPGLVMLNLLNMTLNENNAAQVRRKLDDLLMQLPWTMLSKAIDLTWKDVVEATRGGADPAAPTARGAAAAAGAGRAGATNRRHNARGQDRGAQRHGKRHRG